MKPESHLFVSFILQNELLTFSRSFLKLLGNHTRWAGLLTLLPEHERLPEKNQWHLCSYFDKGQLTAAGLFRIYT